jgi:intracellular multiplication protein IcmO
VNLPALENSDDTLAALGKIVVASLRGMMAQLLGARIEGDPREIFVAKPGMGQGPYHVVFDELAYYATSGMDRMLAMGRGLNMMFWLGFQEVGGIWARLGEKTSSLLGNANLTVAMRQQDAYRTREWIEKTAGQTYVTQALSYHGSAEGAYREAQAAELRQVARVDWQDLQKQIEGEAIVLFGGRRIYAKVFHAALPGGGPIRLNRALVLPAPDAADQDRAERIANLRARILAGELIGSGEDPDQRDPSEAILEAFLDGMGAAETGDLPERVAAGLSVAAGPIAAELERHAAEVAVAAPARPPTQAVVTELDPMLDGREGTPPDTARSPAPSDPINVRCFALLAAAELRASASQDQARAQALATMGARDAAAAAILLPEPPATEPAAFVAYVRRLTDMLLRQSGTAVLTSAEDGPSISG